MERTRKIWGERWLIRKDSTHATSVLKLEAGYECSWHRHAAKYNLFVVLEGCITIVTEEPGLNGPKSTELGVGDCFSTKPGQWHKFQAVMNSVVVEEMYVDYDEGDIERRSLGGPFMTTDEACKVNTSRKLGEITIADTNQSRWVKSNG